MCVGAGGGGGDEGLELPVPLLLGPLPFTILSWNTCTQYH